MTWNIIVDSSSDMLSNTLQSEAFTFKTVPLTIQVEDRSYVDTPDMDVKAMITDMMGTKSASSTACPSPEAFFEAFASADCTVCITLTGALSGTYNCAVLARQMVLEQYPDKKILVINSKSTAGSLAILAKKAATLIEQGRSFEEIEQILTPYSDQKVLFTLSCFDNLVKNGRMNAIVGMVASKLNIRAIACNTQEGEIKVLKKCHGEVKCYDELVKLLIERRTDENPIIISHCQCYEGALKLQELLAQKIKNTDITICECRGLTSYYTMPGGIIVAY